MTTELNAKGIGIAVAPVVRYRNLPVAIDWLCKAFGFEKHQVTVDDNGTVLFAQLVFGNAMIMVGPVRASAFDKLLKQPDEIGGAETQVCYIVVTDARAHSARAKAAGAEIVFDIEDPARGGRSYSCRDPEGHLWNFGTYNPWQSQAAERRRRRWALDFPTMRSVLAAGLLAGVVVMAMPAGNPPAQRMVGESARDEAALSPAASAEQTALEHPTHEKDVRAAQLTAEATQQQLNNLLLERDALQRAAAEAQEQLTEALSQKEAAEHAAKDVRNQYTKAWIAKRAAERAAKKARRLLAKQRNERLTLESSK